MHKQLIPFLLGVFLVIGLGPVESYGVNYISAPPLLDVVKEPVGNVRQGTTVVPLITWGGDIATIYANGNKTVTLNGSIFSQEVLQLKLVRMVDFQ